MNLVDVNLNLHCKSNLIIKPSQVEDLEEKLLQYKAQFIRFDTDGSGDIDFMELKYMLEK